VRYLGIEDSVTMDTVVPHQRTSILAEVMENFDNITIFQNLLQTMLEWIEFHQIENKAALGAQAHL